LAPHSPIPLDTRSAFIDHDMNLCIQCGKCVRACDEVEGASAIAFEQRGEHTIVGTSQGGTLADSGCTFCGLCVDVCPVGAIVEKDNKWAGRADDLVTSACAHCSVGCSLNLNVTKGKLVRVTHDIEGPANRGHECVQGKFGFKWVYSKDRLKAPMVRSRAGLQETTWDEALSTVAAALGRYRPGEIALLGSPKVTNEDNFVLQKFARAVLGTPNIDYIDPLSPPAALAGMAEAFGSPAATGTLWELRGSRLILVVDSDLTFEHPVAGLQVKEAVRQGAHLIVLDPRDTEIGMQATERLVCQPGSEVAVLGAILRAILDQGLEAKEFIQQRCELLDELKTSLAPFTLEAAERVSGVPKARIEQAARLLAAQRPAAFLFSPSLVRADPALGAAVANLAMLTGNVGRAGAGVFPMLGENNSQGAADMGCAPDRFPGHVPVTSAGAWLRLNEAWGARIPNQPGLAFRQILEGARTGRIKALVLLGENSVVPDPYGGLAAAFARLELLAVHEVFPRELQRFAHVLLPATTFAEREGSYTSFERRVQRVRKAIEPVGQARPAWQVLSDLARRMGGKGFDYAGAADVFTEIARLTPAYAGLSYERLEGAGIQWPCPEAGHPGTSALHAERFLRGRGRFLPLRWPAEAAAAGVLTAYTAIVREVKGTVELGYQNHVELNAADARGLGIADGDAVRLSTGMGDLTARARVNGRAPAGTALVTLPHYNVVTDVFNKPSPGPLAPFTRVKRYPVRIEKAGG
jgi:predicted molibdopterin-dependent oxidoreductase YjgC